MRTVGTFQDVHAQAKLYETDDTDQPMNPVIRKEGCDWMLESSMSPASDNCTIECGLGEFSEYWYESYTDPDFELDETMIAEFEISYGH